MHTKKKPSKSSISSVRDYIKSKDPEKYLIDALTTEITKEIDRSILEKLLKM